MQKVTKGAGVATPGYRSRKLRTCGRQIQAGRQADETVIVGGGFRHLVRVIICVRAVLHDVNLHRDLGREHWKRPQICSGESCPLFADFSSTL